MASWKTLSGLFYFSSSVLQLWFCEAISVFCNLKVASLEVVKFVHSFGLIFRDDVWMIHAKYCAYMENVGLISLNDSVLWFKNLAKES
ncbi:hypothetical protein G9A89_014537 [Geosiphon pyriformis]|nr:hypothetical protein G9A89_014537 [Geosiphon pyriformis]